MGSCVGFFQWLLLEAGCASVPVYREDHVEGHVAVDKPSKVGKVSDAYGQLSRNQWS